LQGFSAYNCSQPIAANFLSRVTQV
jgi:hypothetical protein